MIRVKYISIVIILLFSTLIVEIIYIKSTRELNRSDIVDKNLFISISNTPDLAISTEANYIRHRSLSSIFSIYKDDPNLREYFPSTFVYSHSHIINRGNHIEK